MKRVLYSFLSLVLPTALFALPKGEEVVSGRVGFSSKEESLHITTSEKAIINFQEFNIGGKEQVRFIQPSSQSIVLSRVKGKNPSKILGTLQANGKVFLVNPQGIYFGPQAQVNAGSFLASTLNMRDDDFLNEKYEFFLEKGAEKSSIINKGAITANAEGFISFFAPIIQNRGTITARAGKVVLAAAEKVTLDFTGDGLIQFTVDGELKKALIENYGNIEAAGGHVELTMCTAKDAIKMVVNTDGITPANVLEEVNGIIHLVSKSQITADKVCIDGGNSSKVDVQGRIDASHSKVGEKGGVVHVLGEHLQLLGTEINASGHSGGGAVLVGGDYQGKGSLRPAQNTVMDKTSEIRVDAYESGNGGKAILWSEDTTLFDGQIYARGGVQSGDGGFVETSGKLNLGIETGFVNALAPMGKVGDWLLDPASVTIAAAGGDAIASASSPNCADGTVRTISVATMQAAVANVALCAQNSPTSSITVNSSFTLPPGISLSLTAGSTNTGTIALNANITTQGQPISLTGLAVIGTTVNIDTTNSGASPAGSNITFSNTIDGSTSQILNLLGGTTGTVTLTGAIGSAVPLLNFTATGATVTQSSTARTTGALNYNGSAAINVGGNVTTAGGTILLSGPVTVSGNPTFDTTNGGAATGGTITFSSTLNGVTALTLRAGTTGNVVFTGAVGNSIPLTNLSFTSANLIQIGSNITVTGANPLSFPSPVSLTGTSTITSNSANISFNSTLNGGVALTLVGGSGTAAFTGTVGNTAPLTNLAFTSAGLIQIGNNITVTGANPLTFPSPVSLTGTSIITSNNANIAFNNTLNGAHPLTLTGGSGTTSFTGAVGGSAALTSLSATAATVTQSSSAQTSSSLSYSGSTEINLGGNITTTGGAVGMTGPVTLTGDVNIDTTNVNVAINGANIPFSSTINGGHNLTLNGGVGGVVSYGVVGGTTPLTSLNVTGDTINQNSTVKLGAGSGLEYTGTTVSNLGGNITTAGSSMLFVSAPVKLNTNVVLDTTNGGGSPLGSSITISSLTQASTQTVTLNAGTNGTISVGTPTVNALTVTNSAGATFVGTTVIPTVTLTNTTGNINFNGETTIATALNTAVQGYTVNFNNGGTITPATTFSNTGGVTLKSGLSPNLTFTNGVTNTAGATTILGTIKTTTAAAGMTLAATSFSTGTSSLVTNAGVVSASGAVTLSGNASIDTTNAGGAAAGANITFSNTVNGANTLTLTGGTGGTISFSAAVGGSTPLASLSATAGTVTQTSTAHTTGALSYSGSTAINVNGNVTTSSGLITMTGPVAITTSPTFDSTNAGGSSGANISFSTTLNGATAATFRAGTGTVTFSGIVGGTAPLTNLSFTSANLIQIGNNVTVTGANPLTFSSPVSLIGASLITSNNANISFSTTLNGAQGLTLAGGTGTTTFTGAVGGSAPLSSLSATAATITQSSTATTTGALSYTGSTAINLGGNLTTSGGTIGMTGPVALSANVTADTTNTNAVPAGATLTFSTTINGANNLILIGGTAGNITAGVIGGGTPLNSLLIKSANTVSTQAITAGSINQMSGQGLTTFNGALNTSQSGGITLTGNQFTVNAAVTTTGGGAVQVNNMGTLTIAAGANFTLSDSFSQLTSGSTSLSANISAPSGNILFSGPVNLGAGVTLSTGVVQGNITFLDTLTGVQNVNLTAGGNVNLTQNVGPLGALQINNAQTVGTKTINASSIAFSAISTQATVSGDLNTTGASGIDLAGAAITLSGNITTTGSGPVTLTNSGQLTLASNFTYSLDGAFLQNGTGSVSGGGTLTTNNQTVQIQTPLTLTGALTMNTGGTGANITLNKIEGTFAMNLQASAGDVTVSGLIGDTTPLSNFIVSTAHDIHLNGVGTASTGVTGTMQLIATHDIDLTNTVYSANTQIYSPGNQLNFNAGTPTTLTSFGGPVQFTSGAAILSTGNDLQVVTNNGNFSFVSIRGTTLEDITVNAGTGTAALNQISSLGTINNLTVNAGSITFAGTIDPLNVNLTSLGSISNVGAPVLITVTNTPFFNALGGDVGTLASPIFVNSSAQIFAGAAGDESLADFNGTSSDNTIHEIPSNPPCEIIFNGVEIKKCHFVPPTPPTPPAPVVVTVIPPFPFTVPGVESSYFTLADDFFFKCYFLTDDYIRRRNVIDYVE